MNLIKENYGITFENLEVMNQIMKEKKDEIIARDGFPERPRPGDTPHLSDSKASAQLPASQEIRLLQ